MLKKAGRRLGQINRILQDYEKDEIEECYLCEHPQRQQLIKPVEPTYEQQLDKWVSQPFSTKDFKDDMPLILTNKGERVRSKSEKIMADYFGSRGIAYKYECPLHLNSYGNIYPDFTFLPRKSKKEIYLEHFGMMDNPEYARAAIKKIELYEKNGIYPGEQLILTFETSTYGLNTTLLKEITEKYLI